MRPCKHMTHGMVQGPRWFGQRRAACLCSTPRECMWSMPDAMSWRHSSLVTCMDKLRWLQKGHRHVIVQGTYQTVSPDRTPELQDCRFCQPQTPAKLLQVRRGMRLLPGGISSYLSRERFQAHRDPHSTMHYRAGSFSQAPMLTACSASSHHSHVQTLAGRLSQLESF